MDVSLVLLSPTTWLVTAASTLYFLYCYGTRNYDYFSKQGIPGPKPLPFVGNMWGVWKQNMPTRDREMMKKYGRTFGQFDGSQRNLFTTDVNLIKSVFVKDFDHFINRRMFPVRSRVVRKMMTLIRDQEWKDVRSSVTPTFTSGKIKRMSIMITECADRLVNKFRKIADGDGKLDAKREFSAFTMDVIARCAFATTIDSLGEKDDPFMEKAKLIFNAPLNKSPVVLLLFLFPHLMSIFGERFFLSGFKFFIDMLEDLVKQRASSTEKYHDFVEVATETIMEHTREVDGKRVPMWNREETDEIVIAQAILFLLAGFDTTATTMTNTIFLLSRNPEIQEKLYQEIIKKSEKFEQVNHEMILDFLYLDHVIHEVLRMYPPVTRIDRLCNKGVKYDGIHIEEDVIVTVPPFALHYDEEYYPEPERFNPDRWCPDSPIKPNPCAFMPFGMGPRNCVGMRFAMEEMKIALCTLLKSFRFSTIEETPEEMQFENGFLVVIQPVHATVGIESRLCMLYTLEPVYHSTS